MASVDLRRGGRGAAVLGVRPLLDQLEVVVAELPEELLDRLEGAGVVVGLEGLGGLAGHQGQAAQQGAVDGLGDLVGVARGRAHVAEDELGGVEDLHRQAAPDLHLRLVEGRVETGAGHRGAPAHRVGTELVEDLGRHDDVALGLRHLLAVRVEDEAGDQRVRPGGDVVLEVGAHHAGEQPGADDVVGLGAQVHREDALEEVRVALPAAGDLRGQRRGGPGVHDVGVAHEAAGLVALRLVVAARGVGGRVDRQLGLAGQQRVLVVGLALGVEGVPDRERDAEEALARDQPVTVEPADPVVVAVLHVRRAAR